MQVMDPTTGELCQVTNNGGGGGGQGTINYEELQNKPSINDVPLVGDLTTEDLEIDYHDIKNKPTINNIPLDGNVTTEDLEISVQATYTPEGTISQPIVRMEDSSKVGIKSIIDIGTLPKFVVKNGVLSLDSGELPTSSEDIEVVMEPGVITVSRPEFIGTQTTIISTPEED